MQFIPLINRLKGSLMYSKLSLYIHIGLFHIFWTYIIETIPNTNSISEWYYQNTLISRTVYNCKTVSKSLCPELYQCNGSLVNIPVFHIFLARILIREKSEELWRYVYWCDFMEIGSFEYLPGIHNYMVRKNIIQKYTSDII